MLKTTNKHNIIRSSNVLRLIDSYASDLIYGVTRGKVMTAKHFHLALGLHNITGMKNPIEICNRLRHRIPYHLTMEIQTAQAQKALTLAEASSFLPLKPAKESDVVLTFYWVNNFDVIVERQAGGGAINTTHLVAFQEPTELSVNNTNETISVEYSRKRTVENIEPKNVSCGSIDSKREPRNLNINENICSNKGKLMTMQYFLWPWLRKENSFDQIVPNFPGWCLQNRTSSDILQQNCDYLFTTNN